MNEVAMTSTYQTLIHQRVAQAHCGQNPTVIGKMRSGWAVLGDDQRLQGYALLLSDPVVDDLNSLNIDDRMQFLNDMSLIGDALNKVLSPALINYSILGNSDRALHAHIHPRYDDEPPEMRRTVPFVYLMQKMPPVAFDLQRDADLIATLRQALIENGGIEEEKITN
jgi:diadenosine tetraphosphate (Ap4A) HIT family hydrolase